KMISNLSRRFGRKISEGFYSFPELETLTSSKISDLRECKVGFRASYIKKASERLSEIDLESLKSLSYKEAKSELLKLKGVGEKVSDCVLLFSLEKLEAFPVDVNIRNIIKNLYLKDSNSLKEIRDFGRRKFGRFCGYYNQYLYYHQLNLRKNYPPSRIPRLSHKNRFVEVR
ncbi:MAG: DNA-3-methyladenine glycosylase family protein, partial [Candidatus Methanofastidiosia archaeon]